MGRRPDLAKRREWARRLRRFRACELSVQQFCAAEGVSPGAFAYWNRVIDDCSEQEAGPSADVAFAAVDVISGPQLEEGTAIVVRLPRGVTVELPHDRPDLLQATLAALLAETSEC